MTDEQLMVLIDPLIQQLVTSVSRDTNTKISMPTDNTSSNPIDTNTAVDAIITQLTKDN
jgi:hypothetical protein